MLAGSRDGIEVARSARGRAATTTNVPLVYRPTPPAVGLNRQTVVQARPSGFQVADLLTEQRQCDPPATRLAAGERFSEMKRLLCRRPRRQRRLERIDDGFAECGA